MSRPDKPIIFVDIFRDIVAQVSADLLNDLQQLDPEITGVHYLHGHPLEIIDTLRQRDRADWDHPEKYQRYPLVALFQDFPERRYSEPGIAFSPRFHIIIANPTMPEYKSDQRYDFNFRPILYPIYNQLMYRISKHKMFMGYGGTDGISHTKIDRLFWGREGLYANEANVFDDFLDCIEIIDLELSTYSKFC